MGKRSSEVAEVVEGEAAQLSRKQSKKAKNAADSEAVDQSVGVDTVEKAPKAKKKKENAAQVEQAADEETDAPKQSKKQRRKAAEAEAEQEEIAPAPKKEKKAKKVKNGAEEEEAAEEEVEAPKPNKKPRRKATEDEAEQEEPVPAPKKEKKAKKAAAIEEAGGGDEEEGAVTKKKKKKQQESSVVEEEEAPQETKKEKKNKKAAVVEEEEPQETKKEKKNKKAAVVEDEAEDEDEDKEEVQAKQANVPEVLRFGVGSSKGKGKERDNENTVLVRGLPFSTTEDALNKDFAECGEMISCRMLYNDEGQCKGVAFIKYTSKEGCDKAIEFDGTIYGGRTIYVQMAGETGGKGKDGKGKKGGQDGPDNENTVFVRGLPFSTTEQVLKKDFSECGEVTYIKMPLNEEGKSRGIAIIKYSSKEGCDKALEFDNTDYGGRTIYVAMAGEGGGKGKDGKGKEGKDGKGKGKDGGKGQDNENTVFVRGLPFETTEEQLKKDFAECGEIVTLRMPLNEEGKCKGFAFVKYESKAGCDKAIEFDSTDYGGRWINVAMAGEGGGKGKDGKGKDGKGKDGKGKGKGKKGKGKATSEAVAKNTGAIVEATGTVQKFDDSDDDE